MRRTSKNLWSAILLLGALLAPVLSSAQVDDKEKAKKELEKRQELERKTFLLLDEVVAGAWGLKLPENRSFVLGAAADLVWSRDEKRARSMFWEALNSLNLPASPPAEDLAAKDPAKKDAPKTAAKTVTKEQQVSLSSYYDTWGRRRDFLRRVAKRDPQLALDMLRSTRQPPPKPVPGTFRLPDETELEQEIADAAALKDPKRALQIARESLAKGLTFQIGNLLLQLNQLDRDAAAELAGDIISKLNSESLESNVYAPGLLTQLLAWSRTNTTSMIVSGPVASQIKPLKLSDEQKQNLVDLVTDAALSVSAKPYTLQNAQSVMQEIEQFAPDRAVRLKAKMAELNRQNREQREWNTYNTLFDKASPEEMVKAGRQMSDEQRDSIYREAVIKAVWLGRGDAFREFVNNQVADEGQRKDLIDALDEEQVGAAVNQGKTEEVRRLLPSVRLKEQRALALAELAILLEKKGEHDEALKLVDEAQGLVKVDLSNYKQSRALLTLLLAAALVDPGKAFAIIEPIIDRTNENVSKLMLLDKIVKSGAAKNGEIIIEQPGMPLDFAIFKYAPGVVALANSDFNRTKAAADRFERNELKLMARLLLVQSILRSLDATAKPSVSPVN